MRLMISFHGLALIAELVAAECLAIALAGFARWRDVPWLLFCAVATLALIIAAVVLSNAST
jgi:hypothetical protein